MYSLQSILSNIGCDYQVRGSRDNFATNFCSLFEARSDSVCWMRARGGEALEIIKATPSSILICGEIDVPDRLLQKKTLILDRVTIGMASVITKDIPDNETWVGSPARPIDDFKLLQMRLSELILGNG